MSLTPENFLLIVSILLFSSILAGRAGSRFGVPALLLFLGVGMFFGTNGVVESDFVSPYMAQFIGVVALSIILFSGGLDTKYEEIRPVLWQGLILSSLGVILTALFTGLLIFFMTNIYSTRLSLSFVESMLLASIISSTDSASVFSILRSKGVSLKNNLRPLLELESGSNDPAAFMLTTIFLTMALAGEVSFSYFIVNLVTQFSIGAIIGFLLAKSVIYFIGKFTLENRSLYHILLLATLFFIYSFTHRLGGNGFLAVYLAGLIIGNHKDLCDESVYTFFDGVAWLSQLILFLTLGLLVNPMSLTSFEVVTIGVSVSVAMIIISRPFSVFISLLPFKGMDINTKHYISWVGLKGAVPIVFATYPLMSELESAELMFNIVFFITIVSLLVQGTTVNFMAKLLGLHNE